MTASTEGTARRSAVLRFLPIALILLGIVAFFAFGLDRYIGCAALREHRVALLDWIGRHQIAAPLAFLLFYAVVTALSLPIASLMTVGGGFVFGAVLGTILVVVGATTGASAVFLAARTAFGETLRTRAGPQVQKMQAGFAANALNYLLFLRLVPLFPFWLVNLAPALLNVPFRTYLLATAVGIIPGTFVYVYVGRGLGSIFEGGGKCSLSGLVTPEILLALGLLGCLSLVPVIYRKLRGGNG
jgi:uncharacterized membrane protein YdjX (TVP38/TMEM64 family)